MFPRTLGPDPLRAGQGQHPRSLIVFYDMSPTLSRTFQHSKPTFSHIKKRPAYLVPFGIVHDFGEPVRVLGYFDLWWDTNQRLK